MKNKSNHKRKKFKKMFGEDPEDMFGPDWENYIDDFLSEKGGTLEGERL